MEIAQAQNNRALNGMIGGKINGAVSMGAHLMSVVGTVSMARCDDQYRSCHTRTKEH
jgi:hypothetical protein